MKAPAPHRPEIPWVAALSRLVRERLGYTIPPHRMIREIAPYAVAEAELRGIGDPAQLVATLGSGEDADLWRSLVSLVTIGETYFLRHPDQINVLVDVARRRYREVGRPLRVWSAGCATGEEAWTIAMRFEADGIPGEITASDVSREALATASGRGPYSDRSVGHLPSELRERWIRPDPSGRWRVAGEDHLRVEVRHHNLVQKTPLRSPGEGWDLILCRNVLLYFDADTGRRVLRDLGRTLAPGGTIWIAPCDHAAVDGLELGWRREDGQRYLVAGGSDALLPRPSPPPPRPDVVPAPRRRAWADEVEALLDRGLVAAARDAARNRTEAEPEAGRALVALAAFHLHDHELEEALEALTRARRAQPRPEGLAYFRGTALLKLGRHQEALRAFLRAVEDDPDDWASSWHAADLYRRQGRTLHEELMLQRTADLLAVESPAALSLGPAARVVNSVHLDPGGVRELVAARLGRHRAPDVKEETSI